MYAGSLTDDILSVLHFSFAFVSGLCKKAWLAADLTASKLKN